MVTLIKFVIFASIYIGLIATSFFILSFLSSKKDKKKLFKENELPGVSVIIPAYNEEGSIEDTLKSILASDYPKNKLEVVVIDDGSTDNTLKIAKKLESKRVRVFSKKNGGKGTALNFGLEKVKNEIIFTMDADTFVHKKSLKKMVRYFKNPEVMCVSPAITIHNPKSFLQRIQYMEYLLGLFLRKAFASVNAIHITPGAFSAYRKTFFDKYGGYEVDNLTEDLEMSFRVQVKGYIIENAPEAPVYTIAPSKFSHLLKQRRRWYIGLMKNTWKYREVFSPKYGDLGIFVLPIAWISIFFAVFITTYLFFKTLFNVRDELLFFQSINFDLGSILSINSYFIERSLFLFLSNPIVIFILFFMIFFGFYLIYASKKVGKIMDWYINLPLFFLFFAILFGFWWIVSIVYMVFHSEVSWE